MGEMEKHIPWKHILLKATARNEKLEYHYIYRQVDSEDTLRSNVFKKN
jgi:hypothetical protein